MRLLAEAGSADLVESSGDQEVVDALRLGAQQLDGRPATRLQNVVILTKKQFYLAGVGFGFIGGVVSAVVRLVA